MISGYNDHTLNCRDMRVHIHRLSQRKRKNQLQYPSKSLNYTTQGIFLNKTNQQLH
jgi:hypothetical protein